MAYTGRVFIGCIWYNDNLLWNIQGVFLLDVFGTRIIYYGIYRACFLLDVFGTMIINHVIYRACFYWMYLVQG